MRLIVFLLLFFPISSFANINCPEGTLKEFVLCLTGLHPEMKKSELLGSQGEGVAQSGSAWMNPEIDFETTQGQSLGGKIGTNRIMLSYPFQLFGQRSARKEKAFAESDLLKIEGLKGKNELLEHTVLNLYRLRQLKEESGILDETLEAYSKVVKQLSSRPQLSPEQQVTMGVFKLAVGDLSFKRANLLSEQRKIEDFFSHVPSLTKQQVEKNLPKRKENWPEVKSSQSEFKGWPLKQVDSQLKLAQAEFDASRAEAWPEIKAGVIFEQEIDGPVKKDKYGFGITMPLPFFTWNQGNRQATASVYQKAVVEKELAQKEVKNERSRLQELYQSALETMKNSPKESEIQSRYKNIESLYSRGLIGSSLLIEAHRQLFDFKTSQNEIESKTMEALFRIYELEGSALEDLL